MQPGPCAIEARCASGARRCACRIADLVAVADRYKVGHVQLDDRRALGALQRPDRIAVVLPICQARGEVRLGGPHDAVVHGAVIPQALQQHVVEPRGPDNLADWQSGVAGEEVVRALLPQERRVIGETRHELVEMVAELPTTVLHIRQVRERRGGVRGGHGRHRVGVDLRPYEFHSRSRIRGHSADREDLASAYLPYAGSRPTVITELITIAIAAS